MKHTLIALDIAKQVVQAYWVDADSGEIHNRAVKRAQVLPFLSKHPGAMVVMEACGSAHHWARQILALGREHEVKLIAAQFVRPFVKRNKTDAADAQAIWEAVQRPNMTFVAVKTPEQQAVLSLHRIREQMVKMRTMQVNQMRGLLYEFGEVMPQGRLRFMKEVGQALARLEEQLPAMLLHTLRERLDTLRHLDEAIAGVEQRIDSWHKEDVACQRIAAIPGIGKLTASAMVATIGDVRTYRSGRELSASLGLVPRQTGTGGKVRLLGISKRGDVYLRTLLLHGARAVIQHAKEPDPWLQKLLARRPKNVAATALANKMARMIWAVLRYERIYEKGYGRAQAA